MFLDDTPTRNQPTYLPPIPFSRHYTKLDLPVFTTIRRTNKKYEVGQERFLVMKGKGFIGKVLIQKVEHRKLGHIPTAFLMMDTDGITREHSIKIINAFYKNPIENEEKLWVLQLKWLYDYRSLGSL